MTARYATIACLAALPIMACSVPEAARPERVGEIGAFEVSARLVEIPGEFPPNKLYDYAYILPYDVVTVHRGAIETNRIYIGHYNPLKPRATAADKRVKLLGGTLRRFHVGDTHRMALEASIDDHYMGGIINEYFGQFDGPIYWAVWTNTTE